VSYARLKVDDLKKWMRRCGDLQEENHVMKDQMREALAGITAMEDKLNSNQEDFMQWHRNEMDQMISNYEAELSRLRHEVRLRYHHTSIFILSI
jgi:hypothetical protein